MMYLITYDIGNDKLRNKVAKLVKADGFERIQYSVFAGIKDPRKQSRLMELLESLEMKETGETFKVFVISVPDREFLSMGIIGEIGEDMDYLMGRKNTLII